MIDGNEVTDFENIENVSANFYENLFSQEAVSKPMIDNLFESRLSSDLALSLEEPFSKEETKHVVFNMDKDKSPGPYSFSMFFH